MSLFRQEAVEYHFRDPESTGVIGARPRWTWPVVVISVFLIAATVTYVFMARDVVHALVERLLR